MFHLIVLLLLALMQLLLTGSSTLQNCSVSFEFSRECYIYQEPLGNCIPVENRLCRKLFVGTDFRCPFYLCHSQRPTPAAAAITKTKQRLPTTTPAAAITKTRPRLPGRTTTRKAAERKKEARATTAAALATVNASAAWPQAAEGTRQRPIKLVRTIN
jgi:hypothetical protein